VSHDSCSDPTCDTTGVLRRGMCDNHYRQWRRRHPELPPIPSRRKTCTFDGCERDAYGQGYCRRHWDRLKRTGDPAPAPFRTLEQRLAEDIDYDGPVPEHMLGAGRCWMWRRTTNRGYGQLSISGKTQHVHRVMYQRLMEPIPKGLYIDHLCRNPTCCNPAHLEPVTNAENVRRMQRWYSERRSHAGHGADHPAHAEAGR
jgi:hypothetical protein